MQLQILQQEVLQKAACQRACAHCKSRRTAKCDGRGECPGYGTSESCPPLIVLAVLECASQLCRTDMLPRLALAGSVQL